jgi:hypothetical protein
MEAHTNGLRKTNQCVFALRPQRFPYNGTTVVHAKTRCTGMSPSFHLNTNVPPGASTRKHSAKPLCKSTTQLSQSVPYVCASQEFCPPRRTKCGGSKTTCLKTPSGNGKAQKSAITSGSITTRLKPPLLEASFCVKTALRLSKYKALGFLRSNQNILEPQHTSRTSNMVNFADEKLPSAGHRARDATTRSHGNSNFRC